MTLRCLLN
ncbi:putative membrane protein, partial [Escherichia coli FDA506]